MKFEKGDKVRVKKSAGSRGGKIYTIKSISDDGFVNLGDRMDSIADGWLQLILESHKLSLRLSQKELTLKVKIIHQDESLRGTGIIVETPQEFAIISGRFPDLQGEQLYIKGNCNEYDNDKIACIYNAQQELDNFVSALRVMMKDDKLE